MFEEVIIQVSQGSEEAFAALFRGYRPRVYGVALKMLKSEEEANDVLQEIFLKVWAKREDLPKIKDFEGYLFTMARNHIFDKFRHSINDLEAKQTLVHGSEPTDNTDHRVREQQYGELLQNTLKVLTPQQKQVYHLARIEGMSHKAIAKHMRISRLTVKTHMAKALKFIRQSLERHM